MAKESYPNGQQPEQDANSSQAEKVLAELKRVMEQVPLETPPKNSAPANKMRTYEEVEFIYYPEGKTDYTREGYTQFAIISFNHPNAGITEHFIINRNANDDFELEKQTVPFDETTRPPQQRNMYDNIAHQMNASAHLYGVRLSQDWGLNDASLSDGEALLDWLQNVRPLDPRGDE